MNLLDFLFQESVFAYKIILVFFLNLLLLLAAIFFSKKIHLKYNILNKKNIQNIHSTETSRIAGTAILISLLVASTTLLNEKNILFTLILLGLPLFFIIFIEDLFQNIRPSYRLALLFFSSLLYLYLNFNKLPHIEIFLIDSFLNIPTISIIFFAISLTGYINGINFIDGTNGLAGFTLLSILLSLLFLCITYQDIENAKVVICIIACLASFLILNFPFGKIFLGDLGAYLFGWSSGILTIYIMIKNPEIPNWCAVSILSYPVIEVIFSFIRKILQKTNPFEPDNKHLHLKLYFVLHSKIKNPVTANSFVAPFVSILWLMPLISIPWIHESKILILTCILFQIVVYSLFYYFIPAKKDN